MARDTVLSRMGANENLSHWPMRSASGLLSVAEPGAGSATFLVGMASWACCCSGETGAGAMVIDVA